MKLLQRFCWTNVQFLQYWWSNLTQVILELSLFV